MFVLAESHMKNILMNCVSVLSSTATGSIPIMSRARGRCEAQNKTKQTRHDTTRHDTRTTRLYSPSQELSRNETYHVGRGGCRKYWRLGCRVIEPIFFEGPRRDARHGVCSQWIFHNAVDVGEWEGEDQEGSGIKGEMEETEISSRERITHIYI